MRCPSLTVLSAHNSCLAALICRSFSMPVYGGPENSARRKTRLPSTSTVGGGLVVYRPATLAMIPTDSVLFLPVPPCSDFRRWLTSRMPTLARCRSRTSSVQRPKSTSLLWLWRSSARRRRFPLLQVGGRPSGMILVMLVGTSMLIYLCSEIICEPVAEFFGVMILVIFGAGVNCQVTLSSSASVSASPKGVSTPNIVFIVACQTHYGIVGLLVSLLWLGCG